MASAVEKFRRKQRTVKEQGPPAKYKKLRKKTAHSLPLWLKAFLPETYPMAWSPDHLEALELEQKAIMDGGMFAIAMSRGQGKTSISDGGALWGVLEGHLRYPVLCGADSGSAAEQMDFIKSNLLHNEHIQKGYSPVTGWMEEVLDEDGDASFEATGYIAAGQGTAQKYKGLLQPNGRKAHITWSVTPQKIVLPWLDEDTRTKYNIKCCGGVFEARGILAGFRGMKHILPTGEIVRPDFAVLDDPQTRESAASLSQTDKRMRLIRGDLLGLAGPGQKFGALFPCTVIQEGDLADQILDRSQNPEFRGIKKAMIYEWPDAQDTLWQEYAGIYRECLRNDESTERATQFYADNREAMDKGARVSWEERKEPKDLSALQHAQNKLITMGEEAFYAEMQNDPRSAMPQIYDLTVPMVCKQLSNLPQYELGPDSHFGAVMIDINMYGLHWCAVGTPTEFQGHVAAWGKYPGGNKRLYYPSRKDGVTEDQAIWRGLNELIDQLIECPWTRAGQPANLDMVTIDCGQWMDTVFKFCKHKARERLPFKLVPSRGVAQSRYRQTKVIGMPGLGFHVTDYAKRGRALLHNTDWWRMSTQKAFLMPAGSVGSLTLYGKTPKTQRELAEQICAERLVEYIKGSVQDHYVWRLQPGRRNDLLDALVGAVVACHQMGARPAGVPEAARKKKRPRRKVTVQKI
jgi:hypothetical protein